VFHVKHCVDVVVIGGGHAGCEAAHVAWRRGARTVLLTHRFDRIGELSCNPAVGGVGKGHLVREIDALDGLMGRVSDAAGIQFRLLNRAKGPAVRGPRTQADRGLYRKWMQAEFIGQEGLSVVEGEAVDLRLNGTRVTGVALATGETIEARAVVVTTGTFLRGVIHMGLVQTPAGRLGDPRSLRLAQRFDDLGLELGRLKTGTPPRLRRGSIDWARLERQEGDRNPVMMSFISARPSAQQVACAITYTNPQTHDIIRGNIERSAMYGGGITSVGPRYCPSIEDKVMRFAGKDRHQVFLEPEGVNSEIVYPNGISTSLPLDVQTDYVRTMDGLAVAEIVQPGYAIEYDYVDPMALDATLRVKTLQGLYLAGQINGTTGYEEAAGQGLVAGLNAAGWALEGGEVTFDRAEAYLGVLIDDLVTRGVSEPYRMFTSRAEHRLQLRADNADQRLTGKGIELGIVREPRRAAFDAKMHKLAAVRDSTERWTMTAAQAREYGVAAGDDGVSRSLFAFIGQSDDALDKLRLVHAGLKDLDATALEQVAIEARYAPYLHRQAREIETLRRDEGIVLPAEMEFGKSRACRWKCCRSSLV
jgi:tRNA uridine 5-carboxymethylaminomethyl modification enzyme